MENKTFDAVKNEAIERECHESEGFIAMEDGTMEMEVLDGKLVVSWIDGRAQIVMCFD